MNEMMCVNDIDMNKDNAMCFRVTGYNKFLILEVLSVNTTTPTGHGM